MEQIPEELRARIQGEIDTMQPRGRVSAVIDGINQFIEYTQSRPHDDPAWNKFKSDFKSDYYAGAIGNINHPIFSEILEFVTSTNRMEFLAKAVAIIAERWGVDSTPLTRLIGWPSHDDLNEALAVAYRLAAKMEAGQSSLVPTGASVKQKADEWGADQGSVRRWCDEGKINGAKKHDGEWIIPTNARRPKTTRNPSRQQPTKPKTRLPHHW